MTVRASVIVVGFGREEFLEECLVAIVKDLGPSDELILVNNGILNGAARQVDWPRLVQVLTPGANLGFAGGANLGVAASNGDIVLHVNSDAIVQPGAVDALVNKAAAAPLTIVSGCLRIALSPETVNSAGNPMHFTGLCWAGGYGELAASHAEPRQAATASGGFMALRRTVWDSLQGFNEVYFAYHEDAELSARIWLTGGQVIFAPDAVALHHYDFSRNSRKMYLLERNRLLTVLTVFPKGLLRRILPALALSEVALLVLAAKRGWLGGKLEGYSWLWRHRREIRHRRASVQRSWVREPEALTPLLTARVEPGGVDRPPLMRLVNAGLSAYWRLLGGRVAARG